MFHDLVYRVLLYSDYSIELSPFGCGNRNRGIGKAILEYSFWNRKWGYVFLFFVWFSQYLMGNSRTPKFMFSKINKSGIEICIPITTIWVELQNPIFGPKLEYVFLFYFVFQFWFGASKQRIQNFKNLHMPIPLVFLLPNGPLVISGVSYI